MGRTWGWTLIMVAATCVSSWAARVIPNRFDLAQAPATTESYTMTLEGDQSSTEELRLYLGDWERTADGDHDWGIPINGARWTSDLTYAAGDVVLVQYRVVSGAMDVAVTGAFRTGSPQVSGAVDGMSRLDGSASVPASLGAPLGVTRSVSNDLVTLRIEIRSAYQGLVLTETYSGRVELEIVDAAGGVFDSVRRSCSSWITLSDSVIQLNPGESRNITFSVTTPASYEGSYWSALFVEAQPQIVEQAGTRILSIPRTAIKVFVTAPATEALSASITGVSVVAVDPLAVSVTFSNTGNVELAVSGELDVIDRTGALVRQTAIVEVKVLPEGVRVISVVDSPDATALASGVYQATVQLEYGGDNPVVGVRGFRVP